MSISPIQLYVLVFAALAVWLGWIIWKWVELPRFADQVYHSMIKKNLLSPDVNQDEFRASFSAAEGPRASTYRWVCAFISALAVPPLMMGFNWLWDTVWRLTGANPGPYERGFMLHTFMTFVFVMTIVVSFLFVVMRHYPHNSAPSLKSEIRRLEGRE